MRRITFNELVKEAAYRMGGAPDLSDLSGVFGTQVLPQLVTYLSDGYDRAWTAFPWPETLHKEEVETTGEAIIPWENVDQAEWASAWLDDPDRVRHPRELGIRQVPTGLLVVPWARSGEERVVPPTVWLLWRPKAPRFTLEEFDDEATYAKGALVWDRVSRGDCFEAAVTDPNPDLDDPTQWLLQPVLRVLRVPTQKFAHATHLREREKLGASEVLENEALSALEDEWMRASEFEQYHLGRG